MPVDSRVTGLVAEALADYAGECRVDEPRDGLSIVYAADHVVSITTDGQAHDLELDSGDLTAAVEAMDLWLTMDAALPTSMKPADRDVARNGMKAAREKLRARL